MKEEMSEVKKQNITRDFCDYHLHGDADGFVLPVLQGEIDEIAGIDINGIMYVIHQCQKHLQEQYPDDYGDMNIDDIHIEIMQYWFISPLFAEKLEKAGEFILEADGNTFIWGRQGCGQAIYMDSVVQDIALSI